MIEEIITDQASIRDYIGFETEFNAGEPVPLKNEDGYIRVFRTYVGARRAITEILKNHVNEEKTNQRESKGGKFRDGWLMKHGTEDEYSFFRIVPSKFQIEE